MRLRNQGGRELGRLGNLEDRDGLDGRDGQEPDRSGTRREGSAWALTRLTGDRQGKGRPGQSRTEPGTRPVRSSEQVWATKVRNRRGARGQVPARRPQGSHGQCGEPRTGTEPVSSVTVRANATELVEFNDTVSLTCSASGSSLFYRWYNGSSEIAASEHVHLSDDNSNLTIFRVLRSDRGPLHCTVSNVISNGTSQPVFLNIS
ncbi:hypothetical protein SKAU_G00223340 [Synaphobranchus kaupii]|uniref:Ig-like domain-containing protein n=1 Tax=Synaphobranchus kaupii TaxID=118154 RepID=A0A9Q1IV77_SYNKA|nr:hypothetical protein SKAU_G00223340 [Synaphobranchus kaupii]